MKSVIAQETVDLIPIDEHKPRPPGGFGLSASAALYGLTVRQHFHGKRWLVMAVLFLVPAGLALVIRAIEPNVTAVGLEFILAFFFIPQALLPLIALVYASGIIQDEIEDQTLTYLLIRPIPKWAIYLIKLLATLTTTVLLVASFTLVMYLAIYVGAPNPGVDKIPLRCLQAIGLHSLAVIAYCCLFGFISLLTRFTLVAGIVYTVIFEAGVANMPFSARMASIIYYLRVLAMRTMEFIITNPHNKENIAADAWQFDIKKDPSLLEHPQVGTCLTVLLATSLITSVMAAVICSQREFRLKTPEGS
jgi:ABC-2 type transport system permease protein